MISETFFCLGNVRNISVLTRFVLRMIEMRTTRIPSNVKLRFTAFGLLSPIKSLLGKKWWEKHNKSGLATTRWDYVTQQTVTANESWGLLIQPVRGNTNIDIAVGIATTTPTTLLRRHFHAKIRSPYYTGWSRADWHISNLIIAPGR